MVSDGLPFLVRRLHDKGHGEVVTSDPLLVVPLMIVNPSPSGGFGFSSEVGSESEQVVRIEQRNMQRAASNHGRLNPTEQGFFAHTSSTVFRRFEPWLPEAGIYSISG
jgi:hypothetical protein